jgi:histidinol-phosphate aminotransferase
MRTIYLDRNESQYGPAPACHEVLRRITREQLTEYTRDYDRGVKSRLSERLSERLGIPERQILLGYGAEWLLKMAIHRFLREGEMLMVPDASWWYYGAIAREVGAVTSTYRVLAEDDRYSYSAEEMIRSYEQNAPRVVLIASPNNPTGNSIPPDVLYAVLSHFRQSIVIIDEAYWGYSSTDDSHVRRIIEEFDNVLILRSFSKYYALAGVRMGYAVCSKRFHEFADYTTLFLGYQQIAENLVLAALDSPDYYAWINEKMNRDKQSFYTALAPYDEINCFRSDANFLLIRLHPDLVAPLKERFYNIGIKPKFFSEELFLNHMRLTLGTQEQNAQVLESILSVTGQFIGERDDYRIAV